MKNTIILNIKGRNIENFIKRLNKNKIDILNIKYLKYNEIDIEIKTIDYDRTIKLKTIYDINIKQYKGIKAIKNKIIFNKYLLLSILVGVIIFTILTNIIFNVEIVYNNGTLKNILIKELDSYGIKKYHFVKSYNEIETIKTNIIKDYKDAIEWLDIERIGTKYIIKVEPRKINKIEDDNKIYNVTVSKDCVIKKIVAESGEVIKEVNNYAKQGDVVISSNITLNDEVKNQISAKGTIYGEVWYKTRIEYPLNYYEEKETGVKKEVYNLKIINKNFNFSKLKNIKIDDKVILKSDLLPISFTKQTQREYEVISYKLTEKEALEKAQEEGKNKILSTLDKGEYIIDEKSLKIDMKESKIVVDMFYTVYEDVTNYVEIEG